MEPSVALRRSRATEDMHLPGELQFLSQTSAGRILTSLQQGIATNRHRIANGPVRPASRHIRPGNVAPMSDRTFGGWL